MRSKIKCLPNKRKFFPFHLLTFLLFFCALCVFSYPTVAKAEDNSKKFACYLSDQAPKTNQENVTGKTTFTTTIPFVYFVCNSSTVMKGQTLKSVWIAVDTNNAAPANYEIDKNSIKVDKNLNKDEVFTANFSLSKPTKGWPVGKYKVELFVDDHLEQSLDFTIN